jgi:hypothetical protein
VGVDVTALVGGAVGGAAIQTVLGPLFGQVHERRSFRADVLASLAVVENERWASSDTPDKLRESVTSLRAASLVAGLDKRVVDFYAVTAAAGWQVSHAGWQVDPEEEGAAGIPVALANLISEAAAVLAAYTWRPYWRRPFLRRDLRRLGKLKDAVTEDLGRHPREAIHWDRIWAVRET